MRQITNEYNKNRFGNSLSVSNINRLHETLQLAGSPSNALLQVSDELLSYIICVLRDETPPSPNVDKRAWQQLISLLVPHWIIPFLYWKISRVPEECRPNGNILGQFRETFLLSRVSLLERMRQLGEIIDAFKQANLEFLVLKGPAFANWLYPEPATRPFDDIDLLVMPEHFVRARAAMERAGYVCLDKKFNKAREYYFEEKFQKQGGSSRDTLVELHWDLSLFSAIRSRWEVSDYFARAWEVKTGTVSFKTLHPVDALIHAAQHMAVEHNTSIRLLWIQDISFLSRQIADKSSGDELKKCSVERMGRIAVEESLWMACAWTGLQLPEEWGRFDTWPSPSAEEVKVWEHALKRQGSARHLLSLHWSRDTSLLRKALALLHVLFPDKEIIRDRYPARYPWLLPLSYIQRLWKWFAKLILSLR